MLYTHYKKFPILFPKIKKKKKKFPICMEKVGEELEHGEVGICHTTDCEWHYFLLARPQGVTITPFSFGHLALFNILFLSFHLLKLKLIVLFSK